MLVVQSNPFSQSLPPKFSYLRQLFLATRRSILQFSIRKNKSRKKILTVFQLFQNIYTLIFTFQKLSRLVSVILES